ncbi:MAG TPA: hypothetical protein VMW16_05110, partial [Sedimentisphaerales bacterium]|nr:hypothetical protein [Sedimentisphaerales bacterium]
MGGLGVGGWLEPLEEENARLKAGLRYQERTAREGYSGSSTPSSKLPVKPNSQKERPRNRGGGKPGHQGHGRSAITEEQADEVHRVGIGDSAEVLLKKK